MTNNDVLRRIRYVFDFNDLNMIDIFKLADYDVDRAFVCNWLKKDDDPLLVEITDQELAVFLNGLIVKNRGRKEGPQPVPEIFLNNNIILWKLRIALNLKAEDILDLFASVEIKLSKHEVSAFFRKSDHTSYRPFMDQYLRNFLNALQKKYKK